MKNILLFILCLPISLCAAEKREYFDIKIKFENQFVARKDYTSHDGKTYTINYTLLDTPEVWGYESINVEDDRGIPVQIKLNNEDRQKLLDLIKKAMRSNLSIEDLEYLEGLNFKIVQQFHENKWINEGDYPQKPVRNVQNNGSSPDPKKQSRCIIQ